MTSAHTYRHERNSIAVLIGDPLYCPACGSQVDQEGIGYHCQPCGYVWDADGNAA